MTEQPTRATPAELLESAALALTVALRNVKQLQRLHAADEVNLFEGPEVRFAAIQMQNASKILVRFAEVYEPPAKWLPPTDGGKVA